VGWNLHDAAGPISSPRARAGRLSSAVSPAHRRRPGTVAAFYSAAAAAAAVPTAPTCAHRSQIRHERVPPQRESLPRGRGSPGRRRRESAPSSGLVRRHRPQASISMARQWRSNDGRTKTTKRRDWKRNGPRPTGAETGLPGPQPVSRRPFRAGRCGTGNYSVFPPALN
jgi:hypothetical protein